MNREKIAEEMARLKGTETEKNLRAAYAGESQAHVKYNLLPIKLKRIRTVPARLLTYSEKQPIMKEHMPRSSSGLSEI